MVARIEVERFFWLGGLSVCFGGFSGGSLLLCSDSGSERDGSVLPSFEKVTREVYFAWECARERGVSLSLYIDGCLGGFLELLWTPSEEL